MTGFNDRQVEATMYTFAAVTASLEGDTAETLRIFTEAHQAGVLRLVASALTGLIRGTLKAIAEERGVEVSEVWADIAQTGMTKLVAGEETP